MSSAAEARFRVQRPNSKLRTIKVVALDPVAEGVVTRLAAGSWPNATFLTTAAAGAAAVDADGGWLRDLSGNVRALADEVANADLFVMVAEPGGGAGRAATIGRACSDRRVNTTGLIVGASSASDAAVSQTLAQLRPWSLMVVIAEADDYVENMLAALRA
jgi:hypothetical protein